MVFRSRRPRTTVLAALTSVTLLGLAPVALDPLGHQVEHLGFQVHGPALGLPGPGHQARLLEHLEVLGDGLEADVVRRREGTDGGVTTGKLKITGNVMASQKLGPILKKVDPNDVMAAANKRAGGGAKVSAMPAPGTAARRVSHSRQRVQLRTAACNSGQSIAAISSSVAAARTRARCASRPHRRWRCRSPARPGGPCWCRRWLRVPERSLQPR